MRNAPDMMPVTLATFAMGTRFELLLFGHDAPFLRAAGEEAIEEITLWHRRLNYFAADSVVAHINRFAAVQPVRVDDETFDLLQRCGDVFEASHGAFDITIAPLMRRFGFRERQDRVDRSPGTPRYGMDLVELDSVRGTVSFLEPGIEIDLGGIAKGFALDCAAAILRGHGIESALIHGGTSTVVAIGGRPDGDAWKIALAGEGPDSIVPLRDRALSVSAQHGRTIERDGETLGHVIDPRSGRPVPDAPAAAVITDSATNADAWSTALVVLGRCPSGLDPAVSVRFAARARGRLLWRGACVAASRTLVRQTG